MNETRPYSLDISIRDFIKMIMFKDDNASPEQLGILLAVFLKSNCDYYELLDLFTEEPVSNQHIRILSLYAPSPCSHMFASTKNIRESLFRWTASKYHTDKISSVVERIFTLISSKSYGIYVFNSNKNPSNRKILNDKYVLLISDSNCLLFDISRKRTIKFEREERR